MTSQLGRLVCALFGCHSTHSVSEFGYRGRRWTVELVACARCGATAVESRVRAPEAAS